MASHDIRASDSELIDLIYASLLGEASWHQFLDRLSESVPDGRTIFFSHNMSQSDDFLAMASRFEGPELDSYASHYVHTNPWLNHCAVRTVGLGVYSDQIVPPSELAKTEFFNDWLSPNNIACSIGVTVDKYDDCPLIVSTVTSRTDPELNSVLSDQLTRIAPHLKRAAQFYRRSPSHWAGFELGVSLFDAVDVAAIIVGEDERIKAISPAGQKLLDERGWMSLSPLGRLRLRHEDAHAALRGMLRRTYTGPKTISLFANGARTTLIALEKDRISLYFEGPTVAILIHSPRSEGDMFDPAEFASVYRLTVGEQRALSGIVAGKTVSQIAEDARLSRETIRTQLKSLYAKTETSGQTDLLRLVHRFETAPRPAS